VTTERISILSKGEEQPFCREETEACWQQNRRGHFVVTAR
jgi:peptidoglycan-associated lipoprotein